MSQRAYLCHISAGTLSSQVLVERRSETSLQISQHSSRMSSAKCPLLMQNSFFAFCFFHPFFFFFVIGQIMRESLSMRVPCVPAKF